MFKCIIKSFVLSTIMIANIALADIDGHRAAIFFNLTDFLSGAITKEYLETKGTIEYSVHDKLTLGVGISFVSSDNKKIADYRTIITYFDYRLLGTKDNHFFVRSGISYKTIDMSDLSLRKRSSSPDKSSLVIITDSQTESHVDIAIGRKNYFDNRFCLQYGAGITTDVGGASHFNINIKNMPISLIAFIKLGYWI